MTRAIDAFQDVPMAPRPSSFGSDHLVSITAPYGPAKNDRGVMA
jgi:hypothetical protein